MFRCGIHFQQDDRRRDRKIDRERNKADRPGTGGTENRLENGEAKNGSGRGRQHERVYNRSGPSQRFNKAEA